MKRIQQKLKEIEESLSVIEDGLPPSIEEFKSAGLVKDGIYKRLEFCIQNLIDVFSYVYSMEQLGVPNDLDDIFTGLQKKAIFPKQVMVLVQDMKGMRNILVHKYGMIDDDLVYDHLTEKLSDFSTIIEVIDTYLNKKENAKKKEK